MYYLKYRPQYLAELDNTRAREVLTNILKAPDFPHAFLFVGQKGMGKTSAARILAKEVNKDAGDDVLGSPDVIEMDAASNRGIDEIRALIRESTFTPFYARYRVFIIDEAHMITNDAFNALLKTLEEPPPSTIFILATTNEEKLPKTIISRCYRVVFGKAERDDVVHMLHRIAMGEAIDVPDDVLVFVAEHCDNSFRDAAKLLEDLVVQQALTVDKAKDYLGLSGNGDFLTILAGGKPQDVLRWIDQFVRSGGSIKTLIETILEDLRVMLLAHYHVAGSDASRPSLSVNRILTLMKLLQEAYGMVRTSPIESLPLEIAVVDYYNASI